MGVGLRGYRSFLDGVSSSMVTNSAAKLCPLTDLTCDCSFALQPSHSSSFKDKTEKAMWFCAQG